MKLIVIVAATLLAYCIKMPAQTITTGIGTAPEGKYISYFADTKKPTVGNRLIFGLTCDGRYYLEDKNWLTKTGVNMGFSKILLTPYLVRDRGNYYWEITIGFYGGRRFW